MLKKNPKLWYFLNVEKIFCYSTDTTGSIFLHLFLSIFLTVTSAVCKANSSIQLITFCPISDLFYFLPSPLQICRTSAGKHFMKTH